MHPFKLPLVLVVLALVYRSTVTAETPLREPGLVPVKPVQQAPVQQTTYQQLTGGWSGNTDPAGRYDTTGTAIPGATISSTAIAPVNPATSKPSTMQPALPTARPQLPSRQSGLGNALNNTVRETDHKLEQAYDRTFSTSSPGPLKTVQQVTADLIEDTSNQLRSAGAAVTKTTERLVNPPPPHPPQIPQPAITSQPLTTSAGPAAKEFAAPPLNPQPTLSTSGLGEAGFNPFANRRPPTPSPMAKWGMGGGGTQFPINGQPAKLGHPGELPTAPPLPVTASPTPPPLAPTGLVNVIPANRSNEMVAGGNSSTDGRGWPSPAGTEYPGRGATNHQLTNSPAVSTWPNQPGQSQSHSSTVKQPPSALAPNNAPPNNAPPNNPPPLVGFNNAVRNYGNRQPTHSPPFNPGQIQNAPMFRPTNLNPTGPPDFQPQQRWIPLVLTGISLMGSLGANLFLGFSYLDVRYKYLSAIRRGTRSLGRSEKSQG